MTVAKIMDIIARLPGCDGQAADAVSAYNQIMLEDTPTLLKIHDQSHGQTLKIPWFPFERNLYGRPLAGLLWERQFEEALLELGFGESTKLRMYVRSSKTWSILGIRGRHQNDWKKAEDDSM